MANDIRDGSPTVPADTSATSDSKPCLLEKEEAAVRRGARHNSLYLVLINLWSAFLVFARYLITWESILGCVLSAGLTVFTYYKTENKPTWDGGNMDWILLSLAIITPMAASVRMAFSRREVALTALARFRATCYELYVAHAVWDWSTRGKTKTTGRNLVLLEDDDDAEVDARLFWWRHSNEVVAELVAIGDELCRFLTLPTMNRARHRLTSGGKEEASQTVLVAYRLFHSLATVRVGRLAHLCEVLKVQGLPPNEASRIRQWERILVENMEQLRMIKMYRTPQALRSFARLFTLFLPPFYAPMYAQLARDVLSLGVGIAFSICTSLALTAFFESIVVLEDPFLAYLTLDGINVREELVVLHYHQLTTSQAMLYPEFTTVDDTQFDNKTLSKNGTTTTSPTAESCMGSKPSRASSYAAHEVVVGKDS